MTEHQDVQSLLPFEEKDFIEGWMDTLPFEDKARIEALQSWFQSLLCFDYKARISLTEEERRSVEEEKQLFFNEIGLDEYTFNYMFTHGFAFFLRMVNASTDEELQSVCEERDRFFEGVNYKTALDTALYKYVQEKKHKSTAPAA